MTSIIIKVRKKMGDELIAKEKVVFMPLRRDVIERYIKFLFNVSMGISRPINVQFLTCVLDKIACINMLDYKKVFIEVVDKITNVMRELDMKECNMNIEDSFWDSYFITVPAIDFTAQATQMQGLFAEAAPAWTLGNVATTGAWHIIDEPGITVTAGGGRE